MGLYHCDLDLDIHTMEAPWFQGETKTREKGGPQIQWPVNLSQNHLTGLVTEEEAVWLLLRDGVPLTPSRDKR